jgi:hypothetical protein
MGNDIPRRFQIFYEGPWRYASVVKLMHISSTRIFVDGKYLEHYHVPDIVRKRYDMWLIIIELDQHRVRLHDPNNL